MSSVSIDFNNGDVLLASSLTTLRDELLAFATGIRNEQILGGITADKLADRYGLAPLQMDLLPFTSGASIATPAGFATDGTYRRVGYARSIVRPGYEAFVCGIAVYVEEQDTGAGTDSFNLRFMRNGTTQIGQVFAMTGGDQQEYLSVNPDPIASPLTVLSDGDYIVAEIQTLVGTPEPRGLQATLMLKHILVP